MPLHERIRVAVAAIRERSPLVPEVGLVLGSGLGGLASRIANDTAIEYGEIPGFPEPSAAGHAGRLIVGRLAGRSVAAFQGRFHYYEGHDLATVTLPIRVLAALGARAVILTAATGGIDAALRVGDVACVRDHLNLLGANPLRGVRDDAGRPPFIDLTHAYDPALRDLARRHAPDLPEVVYAAMIGPSYETPAEIAMLRSLGAGVVGMSTVPEAIVARQFGLRVLAFALVTNAAAGLGEGAISHEEVLAAGRGAGAERLGDLIERLLTDPGFPA